MTTNDGNDRAVFHQQEVAMPSIRMLVVAGVIAAHGLGFVAATLRGALGDLFLFYVMSLGIAPLVLSAIGGVVGVAMGILTTRSNVDGPCITTRMPDTAQVAAIVAGIVVLAAGKLAIHKVSGIQPAGISYVLIA